MIWLSDRVSLETKSLPERQVAQVEPWWNPLSQTIILQISSLWSKITHHRGFLLWLTQSKIESSVKWQRIYFLRLNVDSCIVQNLLNVLLLVPQHISGAVLIIENNHSVQCQQSTQRWMIAFLQVMSSLIFILC